MDEWGGKWMGECISGWEGGRQVLGEGWREVAGFIMSSSYTSGWVGGRGSEGWAKEW